MVHASARQLRLRSLTQHAPGYIWIAVCRSCGHSTGLPLASLIARYGELHPVELAVVSLRCTSCRAIGNVSAKLARLCDPGCGRQRG